jgi:MFS transporter, DHA1 family, tetracycline resistance protein
MTEAQPVGSTRRALTFIFITVLADMIGFGVIIPVIPELIMELTGEGLARASIYGGWLMFLWAGTQFVCAPIVGNLSDRFGRRPVLLLSLAAYGFDYILMGFAPTLAWLFLGRFVAGMTGATYSTASAYIADVSPPEKRAQNFGLVGAAFGLGFILGPVLGGLLGGLGSRVPFFAAAGLALCNFVYGALVLPETLPHSLRRPFSIRRANPVGALVQMRRYPVVIGLFVALFAYQIAHDVNPAVWSYYTMLKFGWNEAQVGLSLGFVGLVLAIMQGGVIRTVIPRIGQQRTVFVGYALMTFGFLGFAFATKGWMIFALIVPWAVGAMAAPALRGIVSIQVPAYAQGELQGALSSIASLSAIIAPLVMTRIFFRFSGDGTAVSFPGAPFLLAALLTVVAVLQFWRVMRSDEAVREAPSEAGAEAESAGA